MLCPNCKFGDLFPVTITREDPETGQQTGNEGFLCTECGYVVENCERR